MIAHAPLPPRARRHLSQADQERFLQMLPIIRSVAQFAVRVRRSVERQELIAAVIPNCFVAFCRLVARNKADLAYASALALFGVKHVADGRRVGTRLNIRDVSSSHCQLRKGVRMHPLWRFDPTHGRWREIVVEDGRATPADVAATRIDFAAWLGQLPPRDRSVAKVLATGERTVDAASRFRVSRPRISQLRRELRENWEQFQGERLAAAV